DEIVVPILNALAQQPQPIAGPALLSDKSIPGSVGAQKEAMIAARSQGLIDMRGIRGGARYAITTKGRAALKKKPPAGPRPTSAPLKRAARRKLRRERKSHRR